MLGPSHCARGRVDPIDLVVPGRQVELQAFVIFAGGGDVTALLPALAVVKIQSILAPGLADRPPMRFRRNPTFHKVLVLMHFDKVDTVQERFQALEAVQKLGVVGGLPGGIVNGEQAVQLIEACSPAD